MSRRRYTEKEKAGFLAKFERSKSNVATFCRENGLAYQTFLSWRRRRGTAPLAPAVRSSGPEFVEVELAASAPLPGHGSGDPAVELILAGGSVLRIYPSPPHRS